MYLYRAWAKLGIAVIPRAGQDNEYYNDGVKIPRAQALNIAMKKSGKEIDLRPYYGSEPDSNIIYPYYD